VIVDKWQADYCFDYNHRRVFSTQTH
jgi:hypothetical protein